MSENTPERLREFRATYSPGPQRPLITSYLQMALLLVGFALVA